MKEKVYDKNVFMRNGGLILLGKWNGGFEIEIIIIMSVDFIIVIIVIKLGIC